MVGDSIANAIYSGYTTHSGTHSETIMGDPFKEGARIQGATFKISGVCIDPLSNGNVTYLKLAELENITGITRPNFALVTVDTAADFEAVLAQIQASLHDLDPNLTAISLNETIQTNNDFLGSLWSVIMFLPAFALAAAALCLISYLFISIDEQHQELAILRATGATPRTVLSVLAVQSLTVLLASFGVGASLGTIICLLILTTHPVVSAFTVVAISGWLLSALAVMFLISLYPAVKFAKKPLLQILS